LAAPFAKLSSVHEAEGLNTSHQRSLPNDPPWTTAAAIGLWILSVLAIILVPLIFLLPYAASQQSANGSGMAELLKNDPFAVILQVAAIIPAHAITLVLAWVLVTKMGQFSFRETLGWSGAGMRWWQYAAILAAFFCFALVVNSQFPEQENDLLRILKSSRTAVYLLAFMATFTAPIVEEVIYRGVLYSALQRTIGVAGAVAAVTFLFALVHVPQYYPSFSTIFLLIVLSLILTLIRAATGNLLPCIILHTIFNAIQSAILIAEPYLPIPPITPEAPGALFLLIG
jgi:uncharacterized protein